VAREETKTGFSPEEMLEYFAERKFENLRATHICGLMGMASNTDDTERVRQDFAILSSLKRQIEEMCPDLRGFHPEHGHEPRPRHRRGGGFDHGEDRHRHIRRTLILTHIQKSKK
jgi:hypothetical protein